ncbi:MAG: hypothetical protein Q8N62_05130, partial [Candidatus Omnitrophota bacterium]|nr:hypothetical protein [Candidatus Omnitrophota bacterium]
GSFFPKRRRLGKQFSPSRVLGVIFPQAPEAGEKVLPLAGARGHFSPSAGGWGKMRRCLRMDITIRYMLRPAAHCKEGCSRLSWV